jgi:YggT family protein
VRFLIDLTEPICAPLRRVIPFVGPLDLSPMVAMILVQLVGGLVIQVLANAAYRY